MKYVAQVEGEDIIRVVLQYLLDAKLYRAFSVRHSSLTAFVEMLGRSCKRKLKCA